MLEVYLVATGTSSALVHEERVELRAGHVLPLKPGEPHTMLDSSDDYLQVVTQTPFVPEDKISD